MGLIYFPSKYDEHMIQLKHPTVSIFNEYIPVTALRNGELLETRKGKVLYYSMYVGRPTFSVRQYSDFCTNILNDRRNTFCMITHASVADQRYIGSTGVLFHNDLTIPANPKTTLLMTLAVKQRYLFEFDKNDPDPKHFALILNKKFYNDEIFFKLYRNVNKYYIERMAEEVDVIHTDNINDLCYNPKGLKMPKFRTMQEKMKHLNSINQLLHENLKAEQKRREQQQREQREAHDRRIQAAVSSTAAFNFA